MNISRKQTIQGFFLISIITVVCILLNNLAINLIRTDMGLSFSWLRQPAGFALAEYSLPFKPSDSYAWALVIGWINSLKVILFGLILASLLGVIAGFARITKNHFLKQVSIGYVILIRQIPLLIQLLFWYFVAFLSLSEKPLELFGSLITVSNQGFSILGLKLTVEFSALLIGLSVFTGASIAEVVRGGLNSVKKGQWEAYRSLGISERTGLIKVILPQALPAIIPGLTSQYLNLAKNSTLAIAIGYSDLYAVSDTTITQTGRAIEGFTVLLTSFLLLNLIINWGMNLLNRMVMNTNPHIS